jgi:nitrite reductase/ring-hydroxylating ferredoxin subunit
LSTGEALMSGPCKYLALCKASAVAPGKVIKIEKEGLTLAVFNVDGEYFVTNDACTHGPGSLSEGEVDGDVVECDFHNGSFNIRTGEPVASPCIVPLKTYKARLEAGEIAIETS